MMAGMGHTARERLTGAGQGELSVGTGRGGPNALTLAGVRGPARQAVAEGPLEAVVLLGQLLDGLLQVDALLLLILQRPLPFPAVSLCQRQEVPAGLEGALCEQSLSHHGQGGRCGLCPSHPRVSPAPLLPPGASRGPGFLRAGWERGVLSETTALTDPVLRPQLTGAILQVGGEGHPRDQRLSSQRLFCKTLGPLQVRGSPPSLKGQGAGPMCPHLSPITRFSRRAGIYADRCLGTGWVGGDCGRKAISLRLTGSGDRRACPRAVTSRGYFDFANNGSIRRPCSCEAALGLPCNMGTLQVGLGEPRETWILQWPPPRLRSPSLPHHCSPQVGPYHPN